MSNNAQDTIIDNKPKYEPKKYLENLSESNYIVVEKISDYGAFSEAGFSCLLVFDPVFTDDNKEELIKSEVNLYFVIYTDKDGKRRAYKHAIDYFAYVLDLNSPLEACDILDLSLNLEDFKKLIDSAIDNAKSYKSILAEEQLLSTISENKCLHPSMDFIDSNLIYGFNHGTQHFFISNHRILSIDDIKEEYSLRSNPNSSGFSKRGISNYLNKQPVDYKQITERIVDLFNRYLVFQYDWQPYIIAYWLVGTYFYRCFPLYPYLWIQSPTKRCGKTRLLELCSELAFNCDGIQTAPTEAILYRDPEISGGTLCWDEVENLSKSKEKGERIEIINSAYRKGATIKRCHGKDHNIKSFEVYRPIILSGIQKLPDTIIDRSIKIELIRKPQSDHIQRLQIDKLKNEIQSIKDDIYNFALNRTPQILQAYEDINESVIPLGVDDRLRDGLEIIYSVASGFYVNKPEYFKETIQLLNAASITLGANRNQEEEDIYFIRAISLLKDRIDQKGSGFVITSAEAVELFKGEGIDWVQEPRHAQALLRKLGFRSNSHRDQYSNTIRGYRIEKTKIEQLYSCYCNAILPEKTVTSVTS